MPERLKPQDLPVSSERVRVLARQYQDRLRKQKDLAHLPRADFPGRPGVKAWVDGLQTIYGPNQPGVYLLLHEDVVVYVGQSMQGLFGPRVADHYRGRKKTFDRVSFLPVTEGGLDVVERALIRYFRPKYNRISYKTVVSPRDRQVLDLYGFPT